MKAAAAKHASAGDELPIEIVNLIKRMARQAAREEQAVAAAAAERAKVGPRD